MGSAGLQEGCPAPSERLRGAEKVPQETQRWVRELPEWLPLGRGHNRWMVLGPEVGMQRIPKEDVKKYELWQPFAERATKELVLP